MKLVDVESAEKEAKEICKLWSLTVTGSADKHEIRKAIKMQELFRAVQYVLGKMQTVDAIPIVRCKDCKFCVQSQVLRQKRCYCPKKSPHVVEDDGYCNFGVRKK